MPPYEITTKYEDPYSRNINLFLLKEFPVAPCSLSCEDLLELVFAEIMGTKQTRLGPKPSPEVQVEIRNVIRKYTSQNLPIPFMVPWGSEKPNGSSIDSAELGALKTLSCLYHRVQKFYLPGLKFNLRIEDISAPHLFHERADQARDEARIYTSDLVDLINILDLRFINPVPESSLIDEETFNITADDILPIMFDYITSISAGISAESTFKRLCEKGWSGKIKAETFNFYMGQYDKIYPGTNLNFKLQKLSRYFSGSLARSILKIRGDAPQWEGIFADLSFVQNPPGVESRFGRRVIYRTLPKNYTSNHIPPWRAKGYLEIDSDGEICPKLTTFHNAKDLDLIVHPVTFKNSDKSVKVFLSYLEK